MQLEFPPEAAQCNAVRSLRSTAFGSAPNLSRICVESSSPCCTAQCSAVRPMWSLSSTSIPGWQSIYNSAQRSEECVTEWRQLKSWGSTRFRFAPCWISRSIISTRPLRTAHCSGVAGGLLPDALTCAPCSMRYAHAGTLPLIAARCNGVMPSSSLSVALARSDSIRARIRSILPCLAEVKMSSCVESDSVDYMPEFLVHMRPSFFFHVRKPDTHLSIITTG